MIEPTLPPSFLFIPEQLRATLHAEVQKEAQKEAQNRSASPLRDVDPSGFSAQVHWPVSARTLGADRGFRFETVELTAQALHIHCSDPSRTFFKPGSTIVQARLFLPKKLLSGEGTPADFVAFDFLAKVVKAVVPAEGLPVQETGFVLRILQMEESHRTALDALLLRLRTDAPLLSERVSSNNTLGERAGATAR